MNQVPIALGSQEKFVKLGNFNATVKGDRLDLYYNVDLGDHRASMYDVKRGTYKNFEKAHYSFHYSGQGHFKENSKQGAHPTCIGYISDGSNLNSPDDAPLVLGVESFFFDHGITAGVAEPNTRFVQPPTRVEQYSILWLWMPAHAPKRIPPRLLHVNLYGKLEDSNTVRTADIGDILLTRDTQTILSVNGWEVRAVILKTLLPVMSKGLILAHPRGKERPWRAIASVDAHLALSQMVYSAALGKKPLITTENHKIAEEARKPLNWVKK